MLVTHINEMEGILMIEMRTFLETLGQISGARIAVFRDGVITQSETRDQVSLLKLLI